LLRHAQQEGGFAPEVPLSEQGKTSLAKTISHLDAKGFVPESIYTSPLKRAVESAEMVSAHFNAPMLIEAALGDYFDGQVLIQILQAARAETLCFVGHAPTLPDFARTFCPTVTTISRGCALVLDVSRTNEGLDATYVDLVTSEE